MARGGGEFVTCVFRSGLPPGIGMDGQRAVETMSEAKLRFFEATRRFIEADNPVARLFTRPWKFRPLCADTAGGLAQDAFEVLQMCAERVDSKRRGAMMSLWRQRISVALQKAGCRIFRLKVAAAIGGQLPMGWNEAEGMRDLSIEDVECVPGLGRGGVLPGGGDGGGESGACN